ncbi:MAG: hypothetical protein B7733_20780 [Myxococcales bacterium FL481]|nr:MAG: hypothetical protein B7733_20780 [Myxococcales bacterium FL481]
MEAIVNKYFWVLRLVGVGCVLAFAASAVATQLGTSYVLTEPHGFVSASAEHGEDAEEDEPSTPTTSRRASSSPTISGKARERVVRQVGTDLLAYNVFCPKCQPAAPEDDPESDSPTAPVRPGEIRSSLPLALLATMEASNERYSMATIHDTELRTISPYAVDDEVRPGVTVKSVQRGRVVLLNGRQMEYIEMGDEPPPPPRTGPPVVPEQKPKTPKRKNSRAIEGAEEAINCSGENCVVDREFVEKILSNPAMLTKQARVVPAHKDGESRGFKFYGIRSGSLPKLLGLKNGDLLTSVNGNELKSMDQALGLYTKLRRASNLSVVLERKGKTITKEIEIK